jgi:hypothetical protein
VPAYVPAYCQHQHCDAPGLHTLRLVPQIPAGASTHCAEFPVNAAQASIACVSENVPGATQS